MSDTTNTDWLDRVLQQTSDYIPDDGFTAKVLSALPATRRPWYTSRNFVLLAATLLSCIAVMFIPGVPEYVIGSLTDLATLKSFSADRLAVLVPVALLYWIGLSAVADE